jgi:excisionase family DNA binding protein
VLKKQAAELLGVSPQRISQLIRDGHLRPERDGSITREEVERCRQKAAVAWRPPYMDKGGRRPKVG